LFYRRNDLIDSLIDIQAQNPDIDDVSLVGIALGLLLGGIPSATISLSYACWELAMNPIVQNKLRTEIINEIPDNLDKESVDKVLHLEYLDMVLNEVLRRHIPLPILTRNCTQDYSLKNESFSVKKGDEIYLPYAAIMLDER